MGTGTCTQATVQLFANRTLAAAFAIVFLCHVESASRGLRVVDLSGGWTLRNWNQSIRVPGRVPGYAPQILYEAGVLPEPLSRCNTNRLSDLLHIKAKTFAC